MSSSDIAAPIKFFEFVQLVKSIAKKSKPRSNDQRKANIYHGKSHSSAYEVFRAFSRSIQANPIPPNTTAIIFRFLFPEEDHKRKFGLTDKRLIDEVAEVLCMNQDRVETMEKLAVSPGEKVQALLEATSSHDVNYQGVIGLCDVDKLMNNLASTSPWSHSSFSAKNLSRHLTKENRTRKSILKTLYRQMSPFEAAVLTQVILKDLRPLLYPQVELDPTMALRDYNTKSVQVLTKESAMRAWDLSNIMSRSYRARWDLDDASRAFESGIEVGPKIGCQIGIPRSQKGRSCKHALSFFSNSPQVWAETKYDGERTQIHVRVQPGLKPLITIFSKSKRESTHDRKAVHDVILGCLGLNGQPDVEPRVKKSVILDAEMVPFEGTKIQEFWRIRRLIRETAVGVRGRWSSKKNDAEHLGDSDSGSESSLKSSAAGQHLGLVFFDIMYLEDESLVQQPYYRRRKVLKELIIAEPGKAILADRWLIDMDDHSQGSPSDANVPREDQETDSQSLDGENESPAMYALYEILAQRLALGEEGLVLKAADSEYNDFRKPWVKLKKDYIPGLGDTVDLVLLAAACVFDRALELRVPLTTMTTFYIGAQTNKADTMNDPTVKPHFYIYFTAAYGLSRAELETLNFLIKSDDAVQCNADKKRPMPWDELQYTYHMYDELARPQIMLREPLAVELFGDRFTVSEGSKQYELRWPRITKYFRRHERGWRDCMSLEELHVQAREAMGRVSSNEAIENEIATTFVRTNASAEGMHDNMHARVALWTAKLAEADKHKRAQHKDHAGGKKALLKHATSYVPKKRKSLADGAPGGRKRSRGVDFEGIPNSLSGWIAPPSNLNLTEQVPHTVLNQRVVRNIVDSPQQRLHRSMAVALPSTGRAIANQVLSPSRNQPTHQHDIPESPAPGDSRSSARYKRDENTQPSPTKPQFPPMDHPRLKHYPSPSTSPSRLGGGNEQTAIEAPLDPFFKEAAFWVPPLKDRDPALPSIKHIVEAGTPLHGLHAFFIACRWNPKYNSAIGTPPPTRGIIFLDMEDGHGPGWLQMALDEVRKLESKWRVGDEPRKKIWVLDRRTFDAGKDVRPQALAVYE